MCLPSPAPAIAAASLLLAASYPPTLPLAQPTSAQLDHLTSVAATDGVVTDHALLVLLGQFAQHLGLIELLHSVPIAQKTVEHSPQTKLIQFLVAILAGLNQL